MYVRPSYYAPLFTRNGAIYMPLTIFDGSNQITTCEFRAQFTSDIASLDIYYF